MAGIQAASSSFSCLLSINTDEIGNSIIDNDFETPLNLWSGEVEKLEREMSPVIAC